MLVSEIFLSIQGESTYAGRPCIFVRLSGCNLSCDWCDTRYAAAGEGAVEMTVEEVSEAVSRFKPSIVEVTGGEPLMQAEARALVKRLLDGGGEVLVETNGSLCLEGVDERAVKIVDVKCPSSGHAGSFLVENLKYIKESDEVKFVIGDYADYEFAKEFSGEFIKDRTEKILFAPVRPGLEPRLLAEWILRDGLKVRLQLQIHRYIWDSERGR